MIEVLHAAAVAPAAFSTCCVAADRERMRRGDLAASVLMTLAMLDAAVLHVVPALWWALALCAAAVGLAVSARVRRGARRSDAVDTRMPVHAGIGMIAMAALMVTMTTSAVAGASPGHHGAGGSLVPVVIAIAGAYALTSVLLALRAPRLDRLQYLAMGASTALMGVAALA